MKPRGLVLLLAEGGGGEGSGKKALVRDLMVRYSEA